MPENRLKYKFSFHLTGYSLCIGNPNFDYAENLFSPTQNPN